MGDTAADIQRRRDGREQREREEGEKKEGGEGGNPTVIDGRGSGKKKDYELRGVKVKWSQRVEKRPAHLLSANPYPRKDIR